eukprot:UN27228
MNILIRLNVTNRKYMIIAYTYFMRVFIIVHAHIARAYIHDVDGCCFGFHSFTRSFIYIKIFLYCSVIFENQFYQLHQLLNDLNICVKLLFIPSSPHIILKIYCHYLTPICHNLLES